MGGMHPPPEQILYVYESASKRAEVQSVKLDHTPWRVVYQRKDFWNEIRTEDPSYHARLEEAKERARRFAFQARSSTF